MDERVTCNSSWCWMVHPRVVSIAFFSGCLSGSPAWGQSIVPGAAGAIDASLLAVGLSGLAIAGLVGGMLYMRYRTLRRQVEGLKSRARSLEIRLNEAEALLASEPHALILWQESEENPLHVSVMMPDVEDVPRIAAELVRFETWLQGDSAMRLRRKIARLKARGEAFNIAIITLSGTVLEADGRVSGTYLALRIRPVFGEREAALRTADAMRRLQRQLSKLAGLLDDAPDPVWLESKQGRLLWANRAWLEAVETKDLEAALQKGLRLVALDDLPPVAEEAGCRRWRAKAVIAGDRRILEIVGVPHEAGTAYWARDITELDALKKELKHQQETQIGMLDRLTVPVAIFGADQRLSYFNRAYVRMWGLDEDWLRKRPKDGEILDRLHDLGRLPQQAEYQVWREEHLAIYTSPEGFEDRWHLPDGRSIHVIAEPHADGGVFYVFEDLTEKMRLEQRFKELMAAYRETLDNLHQGIALFGTDGRLRLYNPMLARMWGMDEETLARRPHVNAFIEEASRLLDDPAFWDDVRYTVTGMSERRERLSGRKMLSDGRVYDHVAVPLPDGNTLLTWVDMTAQAEAERALQEKNEALMEADRLKSRFLESISYQLRTPLTSIIGFTEYLDLGLAGELTEQQKEYVGYIRLSSSDLLSVIDTILDLTTIDAGRMELVFESVAVEEILREAASAMAERLEERDLVLHIDIAEDVQTVRADRRRLLQILSHLLSNAISFSKAGGHVHMGARRGSGGVDIWVADEGPGMDPEFAKTAFERFTSRHAPGGHRGTGLGLPLVKSLVELHGGRVQLETRKGKGTLVICHFPDEGQATGAHDEANIARMDRAIDHNHDGAHGEASDSLDACLETRDHAGSAAIRITFRPGHGNETDAVRGGVVKDVAPRRPKVMIRAGGGGGKAQA